jgi:hypothetical protein
MNDINSRTAKAFELAADISKQLIALSTATIVFTATFTKEFCNKDLCQLTRTDKILMLFTWLAHSVSIVLGIICLMKLASLLEPAYGEPPPSIKGNMATKLAFWQTIFFGIGIGLIIIYGIWLVFFG